MRLFNGIGCWLCAVISPPPSACPVLHHTLVLRSRRCTGSSAPSYTRPQEQEVQRLKCSIIHSSSGAGGAPAQVLHHTLVLRSRRCSGSSAPSFTRPQEQEVQRLKCSIMHSSSGAGGAAAPARLLLTRSIPSMATPSISPEQRSGLYAGSRIWRFRVRDPLGSDTPGVALAVWP
jgi:hypothetical protein